MRSRLSWLLPLALHALGCTRPCKPGTFLVSVHLEGAARSADGLRVSVSEPGAAPVTTSLVPGELGAGGSIEVDFARFPHATDVRVDITATRGSTPVGSGHANVRASASCANAEITVGALVYSDVVLADAPAAYYRLAEADQTPYAANETGGPRGTFFGPVSLGRPGAIASEPDTALGLPILPVGTTPGFSIPTGVLELSGGKAFSLEAWIAPSALDTVARGVFGIAVDQSHADSIQLYARSVGITLLRESGASRVTASSPIAPPLGVFSYVVGVYDGQALALYVDGAAADRTATAAAFTDPVAPVLVGSMTPRNYNFEGVIDEVALYPYALSDDQVAQHYQAGTAAP